MVSGSDLRDLVRGTLAHLAAEPELAYCFVPVEQIAFVVDAPPRSVRAALAEMTLSGEVERNAAGAVRLKARVIEHDGLPVAPVVSTMGQAPRYAVACPGCGLRHEVETLGEFEPPCSPGTRYVAAGLTPEGAAYVLGVDRDDLALRLAEVVSLADRRRSC